MNGSITSSRRSPPWPTSFWRNTEGVSLTS
jgi:hypothetical protein